MKSQIGQETGKSRPEELKVFISHRDSQCDECKEALGCKAWICLAGDRGALCLECADLDHLVFLPSGDTALTRRAKSHSVLWAVVLKWSNARRRYERQGLLIEPQALEQAEQECLSDEEVRRLRRERNAERLAGLDAEYVRQFSARVCQLFPGCPQDRAQLLAEHACRKYSGRVGRSAAAKQFDEKAIELAVAAHLRHAATDYDRLLAQGCDRHEARQHIQRDVAKALDAWRQPSP
jgi:hypothetical protein